ncbi:hypothetical protein DIPPA_07751 [Diplonema papillatum]|nr:hypothetical protein DIPPA_07751 [Diplonema papillatum]
MGIGRSQFSDEPFVNFEQSTGSDRLPWKMGTVENTISQFKHYRGAQPNELQHPALKHCRQTRMYRDQCLVHFGNCEYKIEAHYQCLEQFFPKERVQKYRENFTDSAFDNYEVIDNLMARAPHYYMGDFTGEIGSVTTRM